MNSKHRRVHVIGSHTGGEPTRLVISGGPDVGTGSMVERLEIFRSHFDHFRSAVELQDESRLGIMRIVDDEWAFAH